MRSLLAVRQKSTLCLSPVQKTLKQPCSCVNVDERTQSDSNANPQKSRTAGRLRVMAKRRKLECPALTELCCRTLSANLKHIESFAGVTQKYIMKIFEDAFMSDLVVHNGHRMRKVEKNKAALEELRPFLSRECNISSLDLSFLHPEANISELQLFEVLLMLVARSPEAAMIPEIKLPPKLTNLHLYTFSMAPGALEIEILDLSRCWQVSGETLGEICSRWNLKGLRLGQSFLGKEAVMALPSALIRAPGLVELDLCNVTAVDAATIGALARSCNQLRQLDLGGCWRVTDEAVIDIATYLTELQVLDLGNIVSLSNLSVAQLAGLAKLRTLSLYRAVTHDYWGKRITELGICRVMKKCKELVNLNVYGIHIDEEAYFLKSAPAKCQQCYLEGTFKRKTVFVVHHSFPIRVASSSRGYPEEEAKKSAKCNFNLFVEGCSSVSFCCHPCATR